MLITELITKIKEEEYIIDFNGHLSESKERVVEFLEKEMGYKEKWVKKITQCLNLKYYIIKNNIYRQWKNKVIEVMKWFNFKELKLISIEQVRSAYLEIDKTDEELFYYIMTHHSDGIKCSCGEEFRSLLIYGKTIYLYGGFYDNNISDDRKPYNKDPKAFFSKEIGEWPEKCVLKTSQSFSFSLKIDSPLVFANFFHNTEDSPQGKKHYDEYSLCTPKGRNAVTKYHESKNIGFSMCYGSVNFFLRKDGKEIIAIEGGEIFDIEEYYEEGQVPKEKMDLKIMLKNDYKHIGERDCEMRRFMFTDKSTFEKQGLKNDHYHDEPLEIDFGVGKVECKTYFDFMKKDEDIVARITLVE